MPIISVIVPVYNVEPWLRECVDSILGQTLRDLELILVDDGSPDSCGAICDEYARADSRVRVIHKKNGGLSSARNAALDIAAGEYVAFIDSDDWIHPEMLETMVSKLRQTDSDMAICGVESVFMDGSRPISYQLTNEVLSQEEMVQHLAWQAWYYVIACNKVYRRKIFETLRYPEGYVHEDAAVIHRVIGACQRFVLIETPFYFYRQTSGSIMRQDISIQRSDNLTALADRLHYACQKKWENVSAITAKRYVHTFFDYYFRFPHTTENEKYFRRMDASLKTALPHLLRAGNVSLSHKVYLIMIRLHPGLYRGFRNLLRRFRA